MSAGITKYLFLYTSPTSILKMAQRQSTEYIRGSHGTMVSPAGICLGEQEREGDKREAGATANGTTCDRLRGIGPRY